MGGMCCCFSQCQLIKISSSTVRIGGRRGSRSRGVPGCEPMTHFFVPLLRVRQRRRLSSVNTKPTWPISSKLSTMNIPIRDTTPTTTEWDNYGMVKKGRLGSGNRILSNSLSRRLATHISAVPLHLAQSPSFIPVSRFPCHSMKLPSRLAQPRSECTGVSKSTW